MSYYQTSKWNKTKFAEQIRINKINLLLQIICWIELTFELSPIGTNISATNKDMNGKNQNTDFNLMLEYT